MSAALDLVRVLLREKLLLSADMLASFLPNAAQHSSRADSSMLCDIYITRGDIAAARSQRNQKDKEKKKRKIFLFNRSFKLRVLPIFMPPPASWRNNRRTPRRLVLFPMRILPVS